MLTPFEQLKNFIPEGKEVKVYQSSFIENEEITLALFKDHLEKFIIVMGKGDFYKKLTGEEVQAGVKICPTNHENRLVLNEYIEWTKPVAFGNKVTTIGLGDRLGEASFGHIKAISNRKIKPILAQQSIRELTLMDRTIDDIVDAASYAAIQEGYRGGFGADGDHLKEEKDIKKALDAGMTMLTLDCSDHINNEVSSYTLDELKEAYYLLSTEDRKAYESYYLNETFNVNELTISFELEELMYNVLLYKKALDFTVYVFKKFVQTANHLVDFELSIDETETITKPESHFFVAQELIRQNVKVDSLAPRFIGEFQKGIDYIGNTEDFKKDFSIHAAIASHFDYKISVHSGSDKFSVFPIIGEETNGLFHLKTAGTNWLEALRVLAKHNPSLYRRMHEYAFAHFSEAQKYYHITPNLDRIPSLDEVKDEDLPNFLNDEDARQVLHVTYGVLLTAKKDNGEFLFKEEFFENIRSLEDEYTKGLEKHITKHLETLQIPTI